MLILLAMSEKNCLCGNTKSFESCCALLLKREKSASTAEELMRSRFAAFCVKDIDYVMNTTDPLTRRQFDRAANLQWANGSEFLKLEIIKATEQNTSAHVEFKAYFKTLGSDEVLLHHEKARFAKRFGQWYFQDGKILNE
jgi:SEC-C motif-containing protein